MKIKKLLLLFIILGTSMINYGCMITQEDYLCLGFYLPDNWNRDTKFEEYREQKIFSLYIYVSDNPASGEFDLGKLKKKLYSLKLIFPE